MRGVNDCVNGPGVVILFAGRIGLCYPRVMVDAEHTTGRNVDPVGLLAALIRHKPVTTQDAGKSVSNKDIIDYIETLLKPLGGQIVRTTNVPGEGATVSQHALYKQFGEQHSMIVRFGPDVPGGVLLSTHTDVQPAPPEQWGEKRPFKLREKSRNGEMVYEGRGTTDMLGFCTNMIRVAHMLKGQTLTKPVYLAFSWGEEVGCAGMSDMMRLLKAHSIRPNVYVIGEGTGNKFVVGHKGGQFIDLRFKGIATHSSEPEKGVDALKFASLLMPKIYEIQERLCSDPRFLDANFKPRYPVLNLGCISGGIGGNTVAGEVRMELHLRPTPALDEKAVEAVVLAPLREEVERLNGQMKAQAQERGLNAEHCAAVFRAAEPTLALEPPAKDKQTAEVVNRARKAFASVHDAGAEQVKEETVSYATEAGFFDAHARRNHADVPHLTLVWHTSGLTEGQAHKADEFIKRADLLDGVRFPLALINEFCLGRAAAKETSAEEKPGERVLLTHPPQLAIPQPEKHRVLA